MSSPLQTHLSTQEKEILRRASPPLTKRYARSDLSYCWELYQDEADRENRKASDDFKAAVRGRIWKW
jgi:hypothetical protein